jgi:hypothetical protein
LRVWRSYALYGLWPINTYGLVLLRLYATSRHWEFRVGSSNSTTAGCSSSWFSSSVILFKVTVDVYSYMVPGEGDFGVPNFALDPG